MQELSLNILDIAQNSVVAGASLIEIGAGFDADGNPAGVKENIKIGVQQDTTGDIYSSDVPAKWGFGEENVVRFKTGNDAVQALVSGKVTAVKIGRAHV